ncbi:CarD family transcriptional regulator, partial [Paraconexibacter sp.]|uniref:CarD family transcriptional regulator n=1 Tax=Paraconexibacter sp. TaxID=2949640 RepID=UPI003565387B
MSLRPLLNHLNGSDDGVRLAREGGSAFVAQSLRPYLVAALLDGVDGSAAAGRPAIVVAGDDRQARDIAADLRAWLHPRPVRFCPSRGVAYESHLAPPPHLVGLRIAALDALVSWDADDAAAEPPVVVVSAVALSEKVPDPALRPKSFTLKVGDLVDLDELSADLVAAGYERVDQVDDRGQFAVRGGILDVYPATEDRAVRVDLFDIEIESLRGFSTFTQRSLDDLAEIEIAPAAELSAEHRSDAETATVLDADDRPDIAELLPVDRFHAFLDLAPQDAVVYLAAEEEVAPALADHWQDVCAAFHDTDAHHLYVAPDAITAALTERAHVRLSSISSDQDMEFRAQAADTSARSLKEAEPELEKLVRSSYRTVVAFPRRGDGERAAYNFARLKADWLDPDDVGRWISPKERELEGPPVVTFVQARLRDGFIAPGINLAVIPDHRLFRRRRQQREDATRGGGKGAIKRGALRSFADLRTGDIIVHEDHGVARFAGFETKTVAGVTRDYLELEYAGSDKVFLPVDQLQKISRYVGAGGSHPALSKLGGKSWETLKSRARRAAQELAGELINLYAERRRRQGHAFPEDSEWMREFEERFAWTETADQKDAIEAVKGDMESGRPMDRLICGDVGYGKTEVALRAAFKAADDGKQVLVLAPTTILAQQHFGSFSERMKDYPFTIDHVSRFRTPKEQKEAVASFNDGKV